jgi:hypothetical protein
MTKASPRNLTSPKSFSGSAQRPYRGSEPRKTTVYTHPLPPPDPGFLTLGSNVSSIL